MADNKLFTTSNLHYRCTVTYTGEQPVISTQNIPCGLMFKGATTIEDQLSYADEQKLDIFTRYYATFDQETQASDAKRGWSQYEMTFQTRTYSVLSIEVRRRERGIIWRVSLKKTDA